MFKKKKKILQKQETKTSKNKQKKKNGDGLAHAVSQLIKVCLFVFVINLGALNVLITSTGSSPSRLNQARLCPQHSLNINV